MKRDTPIELDFVQEANNCERMKEIFKDESRINVPKIYRKYSTSRLLTMSFEEGNFITDFEAIKKLNLTNNDIVKYLVRQQ